MATNVDFNGLVLSLVHGKRLTEGQIKKLARAMRKFELEILTVPYGAIVINGKDKFGNDWLIFSSHFGMIAICGKWEHEIFMPMRNAEAKMRGL